MGRIHLGNGPLPRTADVVVIGAGLVGLATAFYAARAGLGRVVVVERHAALADLTSKHSAEGFRLEWDARENIAMVRETIEVFQHFADVVGVDQPIGLQQQGYLFVSSEDGESTTVEGALRAARLRERAVRWQESELPDVEYLSGDQARRRFPWLSLAVHSAHFRAGDGFVSAEGVARGFARGGAFETFLETAVARIEVAAGRAAGVLTEGGERIGAGAVVVAAGPFSAQLVETTGARLPIHLRRRHGLVVYAPPGLIDPAGPMVVDADLGLYWRPRPEGLFVGWERALAADQQPEAPRDPVPASWRYLTRVRRFGRRLTTFWHALDFENVLWHVGQYVAPGCEDGRPIIGPHPDVAGLFVNTAYEGRGVMASAGGGRLLVDLLRGAERAESNPFRVFADARGNPVDQMVL